MFPGNTPPLCRQPSSFHWHWIRSSCTGSLWTWLRPIRGSLIRVWRRPIQPSSSESSESQQTKRCPKVMLKPYVYLAFWFIAVHVWMPDFGRRCCEAHAVPVILPATYSWLSQNAALASVLWCVSMSVFPCWRFWFQKLFVWGILVSSRWMTFDDLWGRYRHDTPMYSVSWFWLILKIQSLCQTGRKNMYSSLLDAETTYETRAFLAVWYLRYTGKLRTFGRFRKNKLFQ